LHSGSTLSRRAAWLVTLHYRSAVCAPSSSWCPAWMCQHMAWAGRPAPIADPCAVVCCCCLVVHAAKPLLH
jgi:hypothetical protein